MDLGLPPNCFKFEHHSLSVSYQLHLLKRNSGDRLWEVKNVSLLTCVWESVLLDITDPLPRYLGSNPILLWTHVAISKELLSLLQIDL